MKLYTLTYSANTPTRQQVNVPTNTDYMVGVKIEKDGRQLDLQPSQVTLNGLSADADTIHGYVTFTSSTADTTSMQSKKLSVDYDPLTFEAAAVMSSASNRTKTLALGIPISGDNNLIGKKLPLTDFYAGIVGPLPLSAAALTEDDAKAVYAPAFWPWQTSTGTTVRPLPGYSGPIYSSSSPTLDESYRTDPRLLSTLTEPLPPKGVPYVLKTENGKATPVQEIELFSNSQLYAQSSVRGTQIAKAIKIQVGTPLKTTFQLTENVFKSQVGDTVDTYVKAELDGKVTNLSSVSGIMKISRADYSELSAAGTIDASTLYIIAE